MTSPVSKRLGFFTRVLDEAPPAERYRLATEQIAQAERCGFDSAWIAQHHFHEAVTARQDVAGNVFARRLCTCRSRWRWPDAVAHATKKQAGAERIVAGNPESDDRCLPRSSARRPSAAHSRVTHRVRG